MKLNDCLVGGGKGGGGGWALELVCPLFPEVTRKSALTLTA